MPWSSSVQAVALMFTGGQATGLAWADVLFGDRAPTGRLPISLPRTGDDQINPGQDPAVPYSEGLRTGYRASQFNYSFPFGHGLTYTSFSYSAPTGYICRSQACPRACAQAPYCISTVVANAGQREGSTVAQLYLEFPPAAGQPAAILKGFFSTGSLRPQESTVALFPLSTKDISYYNGNKSWVAIGSGIAHIGESSADIRQS